MMNAHQREFGWLEQSGITLSNWLITDNKSEWARYLNYISIWLFEHQGKRII